MRVGGKEGGRSEGGSGCGGGSGEEAIWDGWGGVVSEGEAGYKDNEEDRREVGGEGEKRGKCNGEGRGRAKGDGEGGYM